MDDVECIHCGRAHNSFGLLPLCPRCTRKHASYLPPALTEAQDRALLQLAGRAKVRSNMLEGLARAGLVTLIRERRTSGAGGMPSVWFVITGGTLTEAGFARVAEIHEKSVATAKARA